LNLEKKDTLLLTLTDLTPLRSKAERISREYEQIKLLANAVIDAIFVVNSHGFVEWQNQMAQTLFGYKDDQVVGHSYIKLLPSLKKSSPLSNAIHPNGNFKNHSEVFELETKAANKDGNQIPVRVWVRRKRLRHRTIQIFIIRDMTRSLEAEPDRTQLREQVLTEIGQDLHDSIGGMLSGIALIGEQLVQQMKSQNLPINQKLEEVVDLIRETDELTHLLAKGMIRERQIQNGLNHSFKNLCDRVSRLFHVNCVFCGQKEELDLLSDEIAVQLYSIAEEAVGNAIRHGRADEIRVSIENCTEFLTLQVEDNGVGFAKHNNPGNGPQSKQISGGLGLNIMRKRAMQLGGQLKTDRTKDRKTLVRCTIPLKNLQFSPSKDPVLDKTALKETLIMD
jgi:PAS domain S-box-containing protein